MIKIELGVCSQYDFHRSVEAVEKREREKEEDWLEAMMAGRAGVDDTVCAVSECVPLCFLGAIF
jgi:hypothetical protein